MNTNPAPAWAWEAAALDVLEKLGRPPAPTDSLVLALALGVRIEATSVPTAMLVGNAVLVCPTLSPATIRWYAAHELGHWVLRERGMVNSEAAADRVGESLMLPTYAFRPDSVGWHVDELRTLHQYCSRETIARRILSLRTCCLTIWTNGKPIRRLCSTAVPKELERITLFEKQLAAAAGRLGGVLQAGPRLIGFVDEENHRRVITLCGADQLMKRKRTVRRVQP